MCFLITCMKCAMCSEIMCLANELCSNTSVIAHVSSFMSHLWESEECFNLLLFDCF